MDKTPASHVAYMYVTNQYRLIRQANAIIVWPIYIIYREQAAKRASVVLSNNNI